MSYPYCEHCGMGVEREDLVESRYEDHGYIGICEYCYEEQKEKRFDKEYEIFKKSLSKNITPDQYEWATKKWVDNWEKDND